MSGERRFGDPRRSGRPRGVTLRRRQAPDRAREASAYDVPPGSLWLRIYVVVMGVVLLGIGIAIGSLTYREWRETKGLLVLVLLGLASVLFVVLGLAAVLHRLPDAVVNGLGFLTVVALVGFLGIYGIASIIVPDHMITTGRRGPHTPTQARIYGIVITAIVAIPVGGGFWGRRRRQRSDVSQHP